jgi:hypothetical protein
VRNPSAHERQRYLPIDIANSATDPVRSICEPSRRVGGELTHSVQGFPGHVPRQTHARLQAENDQTLVCEMLALAVDAIETPDHNERERCTTMALHIFR